MAAFIVGLVFSGVTAFPLRWETELLARWIGAKLNAVPGAFHSMAFWIVTVRNGLRDTYAHYPFIGYGTDWLAFGHLAIAVFLIGPLLDPVRNVWCIVAAMIACAGIVPLALIAGPVRGIPFTWRLIDCSFGVVGIIPLLLCWRWTKALETLRRKRAAEAATPIASGN